MEKMKEITSNSTESASTNRFQNIFDNHKFAKERNQVYTPLKQEIQIQH
jgi:hypothetical protein